MKSWGYVTILTVAMTVLFIAMLPFIIIREMLE